MFETHIKLFVTEPGIYLKKSCLRHWCITVFFECIENFRYENFLNLGYNKKFCYLIYYCTKLIFEKNLAPEILATILLANQVAGFLNQMYL